MVEEREPDNWDGRRAWLALVEAHGFLFAALDRELTEATGLDLGKYEVLAHLADQPDHQMRMADLASRCGVTRSGMTRRLDALEQEGLVRRRIAADDRRGVVGVLTAKGRRRLLRAAPVHLAGAKQHFLDVLDEDELIVLFKALNRVVERIRQSDTSD